MTRNLQKSEHFEQNSWILKHKLDKNFASDCSNGSYGIYLMGWALNHWDIVNRFGIRIYALDSILQLKFWFWQFLLKAQSQFPFELKRFLRFDLIFRPTSIEGGGFIIVSLKVNFAEIETAFCQSICQSQPITAASAIGLLINLAASQSTRDTWKSKQQIKSNQHPNCSQLRLLLFLCPPAWPGPPAVW